MSGHTIQNWVRVLAVIFGALALALLMIPGSDAQNQQIVINEVQPRNSVTIADGDGDFSDWIELRNTTGSDIDIAGWRISDSATEWTVTFDPAFPNRTIVPADGFLLVWASDKANPDDPANPGPANELHTNFRLSRNSETITLVTGLGVVADVFAYNVPADVPQDASLGKGAGNQIVTFAPADVTPLTPNGTGVPPTPTAVPGPASIVINEVMQANTLTLADGDGEFEDWFELYNPTCETVDMTGWSVRDSAESWPLPDGTALMPGDVLLLWASNKGDPDNIDQFPGPADELHTSFRLAASGEDLYLLDDAGLLISTLNPGETLPDESFGLTAAGTYTTLTGTAITPEDLNPGQAAPVCVPTPTPTPIPTATPTPTPTATPTPAATPTPGGPTATPTATPEPDPCASITPSIVINEAQSRSTFTIADGDGDFSDWIELHNPTDETVDITGWYINDEFTRRRLPDFGVLTPGELTMAPDSYLLIWASGKGNPRNPGYPGPEGEIHTRFGLNVKEGEPLTLENADLCVVSRLTFPPLENDESFGITTDGTPGKFDRGYATPLGPNGPQGFVPEVCAARAAAQGIVINEVQSRNTFTIVDGDGDFSDWIELYNPTATTVDVTGWIIKDTFNEWRVPSGTFSRVDPEIWIPRRVTIASGEYLLVWPSGKGLSSDPAFPGPEGELHTQFALNADEGESVSLEDFSGCVIAELAVPPLDIDESYGLTDNGVSGKFNRRYATPLAPNGPQGPTPEECASRVAVQGIVVNEAQSRNSVTIADGDGDFSDWIELFNPTDTTVDMSGWTLKDTDNVWQFPFVFDSVTGDWIPEQFTMESGEYLLIWASGKGGPDLPAPEGELHIPFRLSGSEGESISLEDFDGCVMDDLALPPLADDESFGRTADGSDGVFDLYFQTPAEVNGSQRWPVRSTCFAPSSDVRLNRVVARNDGLLVDGDGDDSDFIELLNTGLNDVDVSLWQLRDESDWSVIPDGTVVPAGQTLILWASGKGDVLDSDYPGPAGEIHLTFRLASGGEQLTFAEPSECIVDQFTYPRLATNQAYGFDAQGQRTIIAAVAAATAATAPVPCAAPGSVQIVTVSAKNDAGRADEDGDFGDWLELRNTTGQDIDLSGWILRDDDNSWEFPDGVTAAPDADLLVWSDEKDRGSASTPLHTSFRLSAGGETVSVSSDADCLVDAITYPEVDDDELYVRASDGSFALTGGAAANDDSGSDDDKPAAGDISISGTCIAINEVMAKNDETLEDENGEFGDWIELVNLSDETIDLSGYAIADFTDSWTFPDGVEIEPGAFLLVWADEEDRGEAGQELHANFKLGGDGELITVSNPDGEIVARMSSYPSLDDDESFGVDEDGAYVVFAAGTATPGDGPKLDGCDFELSSASATPAGDEDADSDGGDAEAASSPNDDADDAADDADAAAASDDQQDTVLATTGTSVRLQSLLAQTLILIGLTLLTMAHIAQRRSRTRS